MHTELKTKTFTGLDETDLNRKVWEWQTGNHVVIQKSHPDEMLPLEAKVPKRYAKLENFPDSWSRRVDYCDR